MSARSCQEGTSQPNGRVAELISASALVSPLSESCQVLIELIPASSRKQLKNYIDEGKKQIEGIQGED